MSTSLVGIVSKNMITFIHKEVCRSNVIEKVHINFSGREFGMCRRRWRKRGEWRRCQLQLEATWGNFSECLWRTLGRLIRGIKGIQKNDILTVDILVSVCKEGIRKGCYTDISLISSCSREIHPCDNCCTTWAHPWVQQRLVVGGFFPHKTLPPNHHDSNLGGCEFRV